MRQIYPQINQDTYNLNYCYSDPYNSTVPQNSYYGARKSILKPNRTANYSPNEFLKENLRCHSRSGSRNPGYLSYESHLEQEKISTPDHVVPVFNAQKSVTPNPEIIADRTIPRLVTDQTYEKVSQRLPEHFPSYETNKKSNYLSQSEMLLYKNLMNNLYGVGVNHHGDYSRNGQSSYGESGTNKRSQEMASSSAEKSYSEKDQQYPTLNYKSFSESDNTYMGLSNFSGAKRPIFRVKAPPVQDYAFKYADRYSTTLHNAADPSIHAVNNNYNRYFKRADPSNILGSYVYYAQQPNFRGQTITQQNVESEDQFQTVTEEEYDDNSESNDTEINAECKSTQTLCEVSSENKHTQTIPRSFSWVKSDNNNDKKTVKKSTKKNDYNEANITVIIDRGWKEDIYSIPGGSLISDTSGSKNKKTSTVVPAVDLLPIEPCTSHTKKMSVSDKNSQISTCDTGINTYISFSRTNTKPNASIN